MISKYSKTLVFCSCIFTVYIFVCLFCLFVCLFVLIEHVQFVNISVKSDRFFWLLGLNQYKAEHMVTCSRTHYCVSSEVHSLQQRQCVSHIIMCSSGIGLPALIKIITKIHVHVNCNQTVFYNKLITYLPWSEMAHWKSQRNVSTSKVYECNI